MTTQIFNDLFKDIAEGNVVLFLGAGSSVSESKKYLSKQLLEYYRDLKNIDYQPLDNDIVDFVDKVFSLPDYDRLDFDYNITKWLKKNVKPEDFHKYAVTLPWLSIITTNIDLVLEDAVEYQNYEDNFEFIRSYSEFVKSLGIGDKCKVIKLHGCISDSSKYPLLFSTSDFERNNKFYIKLFNQIRGWSDNIKILFVGYSFNDRFGSLFLNLFQKELKSRQFYMLSPNLDESAFNLKYLKANNITPIKLKFAEFLLEYEKWSEDNIYKIKEKKNNVFREVSGRTIPFALQSKLSPFLVPLNDSYETLNIDEKDFYLGSEPNFSVIKKNYDIVKEQKISEISLNINNLFDEKGTSIPFVYLTGSYGSGKSTFSYRLLKKMMEVSSELLVFELKDLEKISFSETINFINTLKDSKKIIFYCDQSEQDLNFKKIRELRSVLSSSQFENISIIILQSIRENVLETFKSKYKPDVSEINIDCAFSDDELGFFLDRLSKAELVQIRSAKEKMELLDDLKKEKLIYDQLSLSLYLLKKGNHYRYIIDTYKSFQNTNTQKAFLFTSLLYQYGIKMPLSLLNSIIDTDWETFINDVLRIDGKGIFIQETIKPDYYLKSDIYFKIKHKIVAENFIKTHLKSKEIFKNFQTLIYSLPENEESIYVFVNLIKNLQFNKVFDEEKLNKLYDIANRRLNTFPRFSIYYSRNLQSRGTIRDLSKALEILDVAEEKNLSIYNQRDKLIIHRKAVVNFNLARKYFSDRKEDLAKEYVNEAIELFEIKHSIDPSSNFSYIDFIRMLIWFISKFDLDIVEKTKMENRLRFVINKGMLNMTEGIQQLVTLKDGLEKRIDKSELHERAEILYENSDTRPLALLILVELEEEEESKLELISEMENLLYDDDIQNYLFNYYGENLQYLDIRMKFFDLIRKNKSLQEREDLNWLYYNYVAESYNLRFNAAFEHQRCIRNDYKNAFIKNPFDWKETGENSIKIFKGKSFMNGKGFFEIRILNMGSKLIAKLNNKEYPNVKDQTTYLVSLYFTYTGIWAKIIEEETEDSK
ncbi:MAG: hypothetical protein BGO86_03795 [Chryseobacterium sp. 36-9]|nr:MAG: hypothetical protein BGO86_03795 [Chryseobacterium sp. 36-9]